MEACKSNSQLRLRQQAKRMAVVLGVLMTIMLGLYSMVEIPLQLRGEDETNHVTRYLQALDENVSANVTESENTMPPATTASTIMLQSATREAEQKNSTTLPERLEQGGPAFNTGADAEVEWEEVKEEIAEEHGATGLRAEDAEDGEVEFMDAQGQNGGQNILPLGINVIDLIFGLQEVGNSVSWVSATDDSDSYDCSSDDSVDSGSSDDSVDSGSEDSEDSMDSGSKDSEDSGSDDSDSDSDIMGSGCKEGKKIMNRW